MSAVRFFVPGVPVAKGRPRFGNGRTYTPAKTRVAERGIASIAYEAMAGRAPFNEPVGVELVAVFVAPKRTHKAAALPGARFKATKPDADNILKILDGMIGIVVTDDARIASSRVAKIYGEQPGLHVAVRPLAADCWPFDSQPQTTSRPGGTDGSQQEVWTGRE